MNWCKVVNCPVSALEERLNSIEGGWAPAVWHFYAEEDGPRALVVFARIQAQPIAVPPNLLRRQ